MGQPITERVPDLTSWADVGAHQRRLVDSLVAAGAACCDDTASHLPGVVVGAAADQELVRIDLRHSDREDRWDVLVEALAFVLPLGCDRVSIALPGRAWSWDDPIPPVIDGVGDLRQRVYVEVRGDGTTTPPRMTAHLHPFRVGHHHLVWSEPLDPGDGVGWVMELLQAGLLGRRELTATPDRLEEQAVRLVLRGHLVDLSVAGEARLR